MSVLTGCQYLAGRLVKIGHLECLNSDTRTTPTLASTDAQACISLLQLGGSWINGVLDGHLFQVLFPILFTLHTVFGGEIYA